MAGRLRRITPADAWRALALLAISLCVSGCMTVEVQGQTSSIAGGSQPASPGASVTPDAPAAAHAGSSHATPAVRSATASTSPTAPPSRSANSAPPVVLDKPADATDAETRNSQRTSGPGSSTRNPPASAADAPAPATHESIAQVRQPPSDFGTRATEVALGMLGRPYRLGGITPEGFDCSGLLYYSFGQLGVSVPRDTQSLRDITNAIPDRLRRIGDLVFFHIRGRQFSHVGLYVGEGRFLHAPASGGEVRIEKLSVGYWLKRYAGTRRLNFAPVNVEAR